MMKDKPVAVCTHKKRPTDICCCLDVPMVKQEFKDDCDVNLIIARCLRNGAPLPVYENIAPVFADVSEFGDFRDAIERIRAVDVEFAKLDPAIRSKFSNQPAAMVDFLRDPKNFDEAVSLGLMVPTKAEKPPESAPAKVPAVKPVKPVKPVKTAVSGEGAGEVE